MAQKRKKKTEIDTGELLTQGTRIAALLAKRGLEYVEELASKKNLHKNYPYLEEALSNVKAIVGFFHGNFTPEKPKEVKKDASKKRTQRKARHKKVSKSKTVRHRR
jgi:hypothetical protein